jgi:SOS-response transcriptional repressor LexA
MNETWRDRLRAAIARSGKKHSVIARDAGVAPETLSRILTAAHQQPSIETVARIAHAVNENLGWLFDEPGFTLSVDEQRELRKVVRFLDDAVISTATHRRERLQPNAAPSGSVDIPRAFASRGAHLVYEASGDSMAGAGILDRDLLFVKPTRNAREAAGRVVVCRLDGADYVRVLDIRGSRMSLLSRNERFAPIDVVESRFELIGIVIGRTGPVS